MSTQLQLFLVVLTELALLCAKVRGCDGTEQLNLAINQFERNQKCFNAFDKIRMTVKVDYPYILDNDNGVETLCHGDCGEIGRRIAQYDDLARDSAIDGRTEYRAIIEAACTRYMFTNSSTGTTSTGFCWQFVNASIYQNLREETRYRGNCHSLQNDGQCEPSCAYVVQAFVNTTRCWSRLVFELMRSLSSLRSIYGGAPFSRCDAAVMDDCRLQAVGELSSGAITGSHYTISLLIAAAVTMLIVY